MLWEYTLSAVICCLVGVVCAAYLIITLAKSFTTANNFRRKFDQNLLFPSAWDSVYVKYFLYQLSTAQVYVVRE